MTILLCIAFHLISTHISSFNHKFFIDRCKSSLIESTGERNDVYITRLAREMMFFPKKAKTGNSAYNPKLSTNNLFRYHFEYLGGF